MIAPEAEIDVIGIRPGEKLHEVLVHEDEARQTLELADMFVVTPAETLWQRDLHYDACRCPMVFVTAVMPINNGYRKKKSKRLFTPMKRQMRV